MDIPVVPAMLQHFRAGVDRYRPICPDCELEEETGDPGVSTENLARLLAGDRFVNHVVMRPDNNSRCRTLVIFSTGEMFLALGYGLRDPIKREALTRFAVSIGYGDYKRLKTFYDALPDDYDGQLPAASNDPPRIHVPWPRTQT